MSDASSAIIKLVESGELGLPDAQSRVGVIAMQDSAGIASLLDAHSIKIWCPFYPWARGLSNNFTVDLSDNIPFAEKQDAVFILPSKQKEETLYLIACSLASLNEGGSIYIGAANDAGGNRLKKMLERFGVEGIESHSKNKCKIFRGLKGAVDNDEIETHVKSGEICSILDGAFQSQIGIYGWNKADQGSQLLCEYLPNDLHGLGADFGCGYGFLSRHILDTNPKVKKLCLIDADRRSVDLARTNTAGHAPKTHPVWDDLTAPNHLPKNLDFVIMNPPFHSGKNTDSSIGVSFIKHAHQALKRYGRLYLVANTHLPYEQHISKLFHKYEVLAQKNGFKVICAGK